MTLQAVDIIFLILIAVTILHCSLHGFVAEVTSMASVVVAVFGALLFYRPVSKIIRAHILSDTPYIPEILAFALILLVVLLAGKLVQAVLCDIVDRINLGSVDRLLGAFFGFIEGMLLVCVVLFALTHQPFFDSSKITEKSVFSKYLGPFIGMVEDTFTRPEDNSKVLPVTGAAGADSV